MDASSCSTYGVIAIDIVQDYIYEKHVGLVQSVTRGQTSDLEALAQLIEYASSFSPYDGYRFIQNVGASVTGHNRGSAAISEVLIQSGIGNLEYDRRYINVLETGQLLQTGYAITFQDPGAGGNQAHHFWFYVQVGYESGLLLGEIGNIFHETFLAKNRVGMSKEDLALGSEGVRLGYYLRQRSIQPISTGNYIRETLKPGSNASQYWEKQWKPIDRPPLIISPN